MAKTKTIVDESVLCNMNSISSSSSNTINSAARKRKRLDSCANEEEMLEVGGRTTSLPCCQQQTPSPQASSLSPSLHQNKKLRKSKEGASKAVRFSSKATAPYIYNQYSEPESKIWYNKGDFKAFADECRETLALLDEVGGDYEKLDTKSKQVVCTRGLEQHIDTAIFAKKKKRQQDVVKMILVQQKMYQNTGNMNDERLRSISLVFSKEAKEWALQIGKNYTVVTNTKE